MVCWFLTVCWLFVGNGSLLVCWLIFVGWLLVVFVGYWLFVDRLFFVGCVVVVCWYWLYVCCLFVGCILVDCWLCCV